MAFLKSKTEKIFIKIPLVSPSSGGKKYSSLEFAKNIKNETINKQHFKGGNDMEMTRADFENLIDQLWELAIDSAGYDVFAEGAEVIMNEFGINVEE